MYYVTVINVDGSKMYYTQEDVPSAPSLKQYWKDAGALLETVPRFEEYGDKPCVAYCNENAKVGETPEPINHRATYLWWAQLGPIPFGHMPDYVAGPMTIVAADTRGELWKL